MKKDTRSEQKRRLRRRRKLERRRYRALVSSAPSSRLATVAKFNEQSPNEDFATSGKGFIALSDGAGDCGLYADKWSQYLVGELSRKQPITSFEQLDNWVEGIWEPFYNRYEAKAKEGDAMLLNKFYSEGSCATLVAAWLVNKKQCHWMAYGDSLLFHYDKSSGELWHSFTKLGDFDRPPYLISCKDPLVAEGFKHGVIEVKEGSLIFACSDALSELVLMMYQVSKWDEYQAELEALVNEHTSVSPMVQVAREMKLDFWKDLLEPLYESARSNNSFAQLMRRWYDQGLVELDDYTVAFMTPKTPL